MSAINTITGNILDAKEGVIVHGCNAQGVMGSGVALSLRNKWPAVYDAYLTHYERLGSVSWVPVADGLVVCNAITQEHFGRSKHIVYASYEAIEEAFKKISAYWLIVADQGLVSKPVIHFPLIGCGRANGDWEIVSEIINTSLHPMFIKNLWVLPEHLKEKL